MNLVTKTDCLVIGTGISGLTAALTLCENGFNVTCISSAPQFLECNSAHAQGGIIFEAKTADPQKLKEDILRAGCFQNYLPAVDQIVNLGPPLVQKILIDKLSVDFDREKNHELHRTQEGGHSSFRIIHHGDKSGHAIEEKLLAKVTSQKNIKLLSGHTAINLLMTPSHAMDPQIRYGQNRCFGAFVFDQNERKVFPIFAKHTVLATGGIGQLYLHSTNSLYARGDGIALAYRAGCRLESLEYVQFHPTTFFHPKSRRFLISEAVRGEGGILVNQMGERFLNKYLTGYTTPELAPRDRVAWAIHHELLSTGAQCVYLDLTHKKADWIKERFPFVYQNCLQFGVDITRAMIPVVPGAHYHCGGIWTDLDGQTTVPGLWAVGETAFTGVHGANRLASTSLLEGLVWGHQAALKICQNLELQSNFSFPEIAEWLSKSSEVDPAFLLQDWTTLKQTLWNYVGLIKTEARLVRAEGIITELENGIERFYQNAVLSDSLIGLRHACLVGRLMIKASLRNSKSMGCYLREQIAI